MMHRLATFVVLFAGWSIGGATSVAYAQAIPIPSDLEFAASGGSISDLDADSQLVDSQVILAQATEQPRRPTPSPTRPTSAGIARPSYMLLASVPNMFGDFFDGGLGQLTFTPPSQTVTQFYSQRFPGMDLFVSNAGSPQEFPFGLGAHPDPNVPIMINQGSPDGTLIATSIGSGIDSSGDGQPDTYPISEPLNSSPGANFVYVGGNAIFVGQRDPDGSATGVDGSVGQPLGWDLVSTHTAAQEPVVTILPAGGGLAVRRVKLAENNSPQPRCRVFFNYNFFNDVIGGFGDVNRYTFGAEKTFWGGNSSLELRLPIAATLASDQIAGGVFMRDTQVGNLTMTYKTILSQSDRSLIAGGLGMAFPTSRPTRVFMPSGQQILQWNSESIHLLPYLAAMGSPTDSWFWQGFLQFDLDTRGNRVQGDLAGQGLRQLGVIRDSSLLFVDVGAGYHLLQNPHTRGIQQVSALAELHYSTTLQDAETIQQNGFVLGSFPNRFDVLNLTMGLNVLTHNRVSIRPAVAIPLRRGADRQFDYEAMVQVNVGL